MRPQKGSQPQRGAGRDNIDIALRDDRFGPEGEFIVGRALASSLLPKREPESHKGDYGSVLCLCGSVGCTGAALLCSRACVRGGAGLVYLGVPAAIYPIIAAGSLEAMPFPLPSADAGSFAPEAAAAISEKLARSNVVAAGSGVAPDAGAEALLKTLVDSGKKLVLDAGMFAPLVKTGILGGKRGIQMVLTPHDGELRRLAGGEFALPGETRTATARRLAAGWNVTLVMKGHRTVVASPDGRAYVNTTGNAGMARGGSGDVLAGLVAALAAQMGDLTEAAALAVWLHGRAGDIAADRMSVHAMTPGDMLETVCRAFAELESFGGRHR